MKVQVFQPNPNVEEIFSMVFIRALEQPRPLARTVWAALSSYTGNQPLFPGRRQKPAEAALPAVRPQRRFRSQPKNPGRYCRACLAGLHVPANRGTANEDLLMIGIDLLNGHPRAATRPPEYDREGAPPPSGHPRRHRSYLVGARVSPLERLHAGRRPLIPIPNVPFGLPCHALASISPPLIPVSSVGIPPTALLSPYAGDMS